MSINIGDTRDPSGIFRFLRTPADDAGDLQGYRDLLPPTRSSSTTPTPWPCSAGPCRPSTPKLKITGLCHSVQGTAEMLARWIGADMKDVTYTCAGINHQAFYLEYKVNGKDAYPLLEAVEKPEI